MVVWPGEHRRPFISRETASGFKIRPVPFAERQSCILRRIILWFSMLLLMAAAASAAAETERAEWTVMFYLCGSDLESKNGFASENLKEIYSVTYPDSLTFIYSPDPEEE